MAEAFFLRYGTEGFDNVNTIANLKDKNLVYNNDCSLTMHSITDISNTNYRASAIAYDSTVNYGNIPTQIEKNNRSDNALCKYRSLLTENESLTNSSNVATGQLDDNQNKYGNVHLKVYNIGFGIALMMAYIFSKT